MIKYNLKCADGHSFDSWFASSAEYDRLADRGLLSCAICGSGAVEKALMAPRVSNADAPETTPRPLSSKQTSAEQALRKLRKKIEAESEDVGRSFATEARAIHSGDAPERAIRGEAKPAEAKKLLEDGIPVMPLPWRRDDA
ncbi:MAG: DUF1178 family protein [Pseudomonadota bacterium]